MKDYWLKLDQKFLALSTREKSLLSICAFVIVAMMLYLLLLEPSLLQKSRLERQLQQVSSENMELEGQLSVLSSSLNKIQTKTLILSSIS